MVADTEKSHHFHEYSLKRPQQDKAPPAEIGDTGTQRAPCLQVDTPGQVAALEREQQAHSTGPLREKINREVPGKVQQMGNYRTGVTQLLQGMDSGSSA